MDTIRGTFGKGIKSLILGIWLCGSVQAQSWKMLPASPYHPVRNNDLFQMGDRMWVVNGSGKIFKSVDSGRKWMLVHHNDKAHFRTIVFLDSLTGFCGNLGPGVYPLVEDTVALYRTVDGGKNWSPVTVRGNRPAGICNLRTLPEAGMVFGVGRIGGPADLILSEDWGSSWKSIPLPREMGLAIDAYFWDTKNGIVVGGDDSLLAKSHPVIYTTSDQGKSWSRIFSSPYAGGVCWKICLLKDGHCYVSVMDHVNDGYFLYAKNIHKAPVFEIRPLGAGVFAGKGIFFMDVKKGWIGGDDKKKPLMTVDGGTTWFPDTSLGYNVNKFVRGDKGTVYSVGNYIYKYGLN